MPVEHNPHCLIVDLEATCDTDPRLSPAEMEIIEVGAVLLAPNNAVLDEFQCFVQPVQRLTPFCTRLTGITQDDVDAAPAFPVAAGAIRQWLAARRLPMLVWASWGDYDRRQLALDCARHRVDTPITAPHINLRERFRSLHGTGPVDLEEALGTLGLRFDGRPHRALDDARNIARLVQKDPRLRASPGAD